MKTPLVLFFGLLALCIASPRLFAPVNPPPVLTCPTNVTAECGATNINYNVTAMDGFGRPLPVTCIPPSDGPFPVGTVNVVCVATDPSGSSSSCTFPLTIVDTTPPIVICPSNITATTTNSSGATVPFAVACFDNCSIRSLTCLPPGSAFPIGTTTVACTCVDGAGLSNSCSFTVTVTGPNRCPIAAAKVSPSAQLLAGHTIVIAGNGSNACVTLDGTMSSDPDGDALTFAWFVDGALTPVATGSIVSECLSLGTHDVTLLVDDGRCSATQTITVDVLTPCQAEGALLVLIQDSGLPRNVQQSLVVSLKAACASYEKGGASSGANQLQSFQNKVRTHVRPLDLALAYQLEAAAQAIIDALTNQ